MVANFSVVANATEAEENLVDSDLRNWENLSEIDPDAYSLSINLRGDNKYRVFFKNYDATDGSIQTIPLGEYGAFYTLTNLQVGQNYSFSFDFGVQESVLNKISFLLGVGYIQNNQLIIDDNIGISLYHTDFLNQGFVYDTIVGSTSNSVNLNFTYSQVQLGTPCIYICGIVTEDYDNPFNPSLYIGNISLIRQPSETEKKLDGILGWLEDIKNSIIGLSETIKTNFSTFFSNLQDKITEMKDGVTEKLGTISTEFSGYITGLGDRVSSFFTDLKENISAYFTDLWNKFSAFFEKFKPRIYVDFNFKSGALNTNTGKFEYPAGNSYVLSDVIYVPEGVEMHLNYTTVNSVGLKYIPVTSDGEYTGRYDQYFTDFELLLDTSRYFRIETRSYSTSGLVGYVDVGWFTYFTYNLRHKIDIKIEEIKISIHDFFVPPEGFFEEWKVTFDLMLSDNLGFIYQAPNFVIDIVEVIQEILQSDQEVNLVFPAVEFDIAGYHIELFKDTKVDFSFLEAGIWLTLYSMYKVMLYVIFALALIKYGISTWERTMAN